MPGKKHAIKKRKASCIARAQAFFRKEDIKLTRNRRLGRIFYRPISDWQPNNICRACGAKTEHEVTTKKRHPQGKVAIPACKSQKCYDGSVKQIQAMI